MATKLRKGLKDKIAEKTSRQTEMITQMEAAKQNVDDVLNKCISEMMSKEDAINNEEYIKYFKDQQGASASIDESLKEEWIKSLDKEDRIELAAEYSKVGKDKWIQDAKNAQDIKEKTKIGLEQTGEEILVELDNLVKEFDEEISRQETEINDDIKRIEKAITDYNNKITDLQNKKNAVETNFLKKSGKSSGARSKEEIDAYNNSINDYNDKISKIEDKKDKQEKELDKKQQKLEALRKLKNQRNLYIAEINKEKKRFETELRNSSANLKIGVFKGEKDKSSSVQEPNNGYIQNQVAATTTQSSKITPRKDAKEAVKWLQERSNYQIKKDLDNSGYAEILKSSRDADFTDSGRVQKIFSDLLDKMEGDLELPDGTKLTQRELGNLVAISAKKKRAIDDFVEKYEEKYEKLQGDERIKIDRIMRYLKSSIILTELHANRNPFQRRIRNSKRNNIIDRIGNGLKNIALKQGDIKEIHRENTIKELYKVYGIEYKKDRIANRRKQLTREANDPFQR